MSMDKVKRDEYAGARLKALAKAVSIVGGPSRTAKYLGVTPQFIGQLLEGKRKVPVNRCVELEKLTNRIVTVEELRPDIFSELNNARKKR